MNLQTNSSVFYSLHFFCWWIRLVQTCTSASQLPSQVPRFSFSLSLNDHVLITCGISYLSISMLSNPLNGFSPYTWLRFVFSKSSNTRAQYVRFTAGLFPPNSAGSVSRWQWSWSVALLLPCKCILFHIFSWINGFIKVSPAFTYQGSFTKWNATNLAG